MLYCLNPACSQPDNPEGNDRCQGCGFSLIPTEQPYLFQNRYLIVELLGKKEFKRIYLARDTQKMDELRVIKKYTLSDSDVEFQQTKKIFEETAERLSKLNHPQIAKLYDFFVEDQNFYLVEEYIEGKNLRLELEEAKRFDETEITILLRELLPVLSYIHRKNTSHGNLTLENIIRPTFFLAYDPEEETVSTEVITVDGLETQIENQPLNDVYSIADPWSNNNTNQLLLTSSNPTQELSENQLDTKQEVKETNESYPMVDPWIDIDKNQLLLNSSTSIHETLENQFNSTEEINETNEGDDELENLDLETTLDDSGATLGRGKKLVLINIIEWLLFANFDREQEQQSQLPAGDIHDLGVICIHLLTGYLPKTEEQEDESESLYDEKNERWLWRDVIARQHRIISRDLSFILDKMLRSPSIKGYQTAVEVIKDLYSDAPLEYLIVPEDEARLKRRRFLKLAGWSSIGLIAAIGIDRWRRGANWEQNLQKFSFEVFKVNAQGQIIQRQTQEAHATIVDLGNNIKMEFVAIPGGKFLMGSHYSEKERSANESPQRTITISPFFMSKYPVTQAQWDAIMGRNISLFKGANRPVDKVSWYDCVEFCEKLSEKVNRECRLPSESEWEYACRAGTTTAFSFGVTITSELANFNGQYNYLSEPAGPNRQQTTNVGSFPPNAFGLYDMHGNVWEWCADTWHDNYLNIPYNGKPWLNKGIYQVLRGGAWLNEAYLCRSANRNSDIAHVRFYSFGCRVAVSATRNFNV